VKAPILYRISSVLLLLFALEHTFGFRQNNPEWGGADAVLWSMRSCEFRLITIETCIQFPQRLPHDGDMKIIARHATEETAMSS
jgi:hypothetical protein